MKRENKFLILIFIFALLIRILFVFSSPVKWWDETVYTNLGYDLSKNPFHYSFDGKWSDFIPGGEWPKAGFRPPLLPYTLSIFYFLNLDFLVNFFIPLIGALTVLVVYFFGKKLFNEKIGLYSALLLSVLPLHVYFSGRIMNDVLAAFLIILSVLVFWKGYEENIKKYKLLFGFLLALSLLARYTVLWIFPVFLFYFLIRKKMNFIKDKYLWCSILIFFITLIPFFIYSFLTYNNLLGAFIHGFKASSYWGGTQPFIFFFQYWWKMFSVAGIVLLFSLIFIFYKKEFKRKEVYLLLIWFFFFSIMASLMPHKEERFLLPVVAPLVLLSSYLIGKIKLNKLIVFILFFLLLLSTTNLFISTYKTSYNLNTKCFLQTIDYLNKISSEYVVVSENSPIFYYYTKKESPYYPNTLTEQTLKVIEERYNTKVYFVFTKFDLGFETEKWNNLKRILEQNYKQVFNCSLDPEANFVYSS